MSQLEDRLDKEKDKHKQMYKVMINLTSVDVFSLTHFNTTSERFLFVTENTEQSCILTQILHQNDFELISALKISLSN